MEQFIPATTIWVAGERWCADPCTVIDPCDYDFELTDAEISIIPIPPGFFPTPPRSVGSTVVVVPTTITTTVGTVGTTPRGDVPTKSSNILEIIDLGLTTTVSNIPLEDWVNVDFQTYRSRFGATITERITP
jgi:hypothetical protein